MTRTDQLQPAAELKTATGTHPLQLTPDLWGWRLDDGSVVLQSDDGDVTVPAWALPRLAQGVLAVHVHNGRPDVAGGR